MSKSFTAQIDEHFAKYKKRLTVLVQMSAQDVFDLALLPRAKGGRMRVDTGFLRNSFEVTIGKPTQGIRTKPEGAKSYPAPQYSLTITNAKAGDVIYGVFTANYARPREYGARGQAPDFFVRNAAMKWQDIVRSNAAKLSK